MREGGGGVALGVTDAFLRHWGAVQMQASGTLGVWVTLKFLPPGKMVLKSEVYKGEKWIQ